MQYVARTSGAFAAVKSDGAVVTWGNAKKGANTNALQKQLGSDIKYVAATNRAFAAVTRAGAVITWGHA